MDNNVGQEIMRLHKANQNNATPEALLDEALGGRGKSPESIRKLYSFVLRSFGYGSTADKYWQACRPHLEDLLDEKQLEAIRHPFPEFGEKSFRSVLEEFGT